MFSSIRQDISNTFKYGNMMNRLIIVNIAIYMVFALIKAFVPEFYLNFVTYFQLPGELSRLVYRPWTMITHMFLHEGLWHLIWNMLLFYTFANILGDLIGDDKILPTYILGGLFGACAYVLAFNLFGNGTMGFVAQGASAAVLAIVFASVSTSPDYRVNLLLIGPVAIKYIGLFILFFDIIGTQGMDNSGGHYAHLGGALFGFLLLFSLRNGWDISKIFKRRTQVGKSNKKPTTLRVAHRADKSQSDTKVGQPSSSSIDKILDKIKSSGYNSLTVEEKEILDKASQE
jgi:membrane associated rhomboid family serine protease